MSVSGRRAWTGIERVLVRDNYVDKGGPWCAERLNRTADAVRAFAFKHGFARSAIDVAQPVTPLLDAQIARAYRDGRGAVTRLAKATGHSAPFISRRAAELGLTMRAPRCSVYSVEEVAFVEAHAHLTRARIACLMRARGWSRTAASIQAFIQHHRLGDSGTHLTAAGIALCLGCSVNAVRRWHAAGLLVGETRDGMDGFGARRVFALPKIAQFIVHHPHRVDLRKAEGPWLIDLLARYGSLGLIDTRDKRGRAADLAALGKTVPEIATILECTPNMVSVLLSKHRALERQRAA